MKAQRMNGIGALADRAVRGGKREACDWRTVRPVASLAHGGPAPRREQDRPGRSADMRHGLLHIARTSLIGLLAVTILAISATSAHAASVCLADEM